MTLVAVDGRKFGKEVLEDAIARAKVDGAPIEVLVSLDDYYRTLKIDWRGGLRYRLVERDPSKPDLLEKILAPRASVRPPPPPAKPDEKP